jgi:hypothetical protein
VEIIRVIYHREPDGWWAESDAVPGWTAAAASPDALRALVEEGVRFALERDDLIVEHTVETGAPFAQIVFDFVRGESRMADRPTAGEVHAGRRQLQVA